MKVNIRAAVAKRMTAAPDIKLFFRGELSAEAYVEAVREHVRGYSAARASQDRVRRIQERALASLAKAE